MWLAVLFAWGNLLMFADPQSCGEASRDADSWGRLKPLGHCRDGENSCPYSINLPPLTIQLPRHFRELEKMARELESLTLMVNQLREECRECRGRQRPEWTDDAQEAEERIQPSRGTVNTKERQQDLQKRVGIFQGSTLSSPDEDTMLIGSGTREVSRVAGIPGWNMSWERNMRPSSFGQRAGSSGGPKASNPSNVETAADSMSEVRELHSLTGGERAKELEFPRAKVIESPLLRHQDKKQHHGKTSTVRVEQGKNTNGHLAAPGNIKSIPEISEVTMASENVDVETKQVQANPPNKNEEIKRLPGFPRLTDINRKESKPNPNTENRLKSQSVMRKLYSPAGDRPVQSTSRVLVRTGNGRPNAKTQQTADRRGGTGHGQIGLNEDTHRPDVNIKTPHRMVSKSFPGEINPISSVSGLQNNREMELNMTEILTIINSQDDNKEKVSDTGIKQLRPFTLDDAVNINVSMGSQASIAQYTTSENKGSNKKTDHRAISLGQRPLNPSTDVERDTGADLKPVITVKTVSGPEKSHVFVTDRADATDASHTNPETLDSKSESPYSHSMNAETDTRIDSNRFNRTEADSELDMSVIPISDNSDPIANISQISPQTMDSNPKSTFNPSTGGKSNTEIFTNPVNMVKTDDGLKKTEILVSDLPHVTAYVSDTNQQSVDNNYDLPKPHPHPTPEFSSTRPKNREMKSSSPIDAQTERKDVLRINNTVPLNTDPVKQTPFINRRDKSTLRGKLEPPVAGQKRMGRPWPNGWLPLRNQEANLHSLNHTKNFSRVRQLNLPSLRMVKNVTRVNPSHVARPERTHPTRVMLSTNPKLRKPHVLQKKPGNENHTPLKVFTSNRAKNTSGETENMMDIMNSGSKYGSPQAGPTTPSPKQEFKSTEYDLTQSINPTIEMHTTLDQTHIEKGKSAPTVETLNSLIYFQIENTSQNMETKLFHVTKPKNPGGKRELDPIKHGVRDQIVETVMNHNTANHDNNDNRGRGSNQAAAEKTEETDGRMRTKPFLANIVGSSQENDKEPFKAETPSNPSGNIWQTVKREGVKELNYPTTVDTSYTIKPYIEGKQGQVTQFTTPTASTSHFMDQDNLEKVRTVSGVKASHTHGHYRLKNTSQDIDSKTLTEKSSNRDRGDKQSDPNLQTTGIVGGSNDETMLHPNTVDGVQNRAIGSSPVVMDRIEDSTVRKGPALSTDSTPIIYPKSSKYSITISKSIEDNNGNSYPVAVGSIGDTKRMRESLPWKPTTEGSRKENKKRLLTVNRTEDGDSVKSQLHITCQGQCDQKPTTQPTLNTRRSSDPDRDKPLRDCSDLKKNTKNGIRSVAPEGSKHASFHVFCDTEAAGGGWTLIQRRLDGSLSFNRTWDEYKKGFGNLTAEFWLGNDKIHWLTAARAMVLRLELEDLDGVKEYAQYDDFYVANESLNYRLTIGGYSGTAGNAMLYSKKFNHNQKYFSTPDRDNDEYPSGNCGAYYGSGWWFDACMAANLNGKYYQTRYRGVRNGIFWGTWHNISNEYYPTNDRQSFRTVRMMIRPRASSVIDF